MKRVSGAMLMVILLGALLAACDAPEAAVPSGADAATDVAGEPVATGDGEEKGGETEEGREDKADGGAPAYAEGVEEAPEEDEGVANDEDDG